jgi:Carboxypeptidase regulatory-like domain/TonB dependent receptor-like, beta-barrel
MRRFSDAWLLTLCLVFLPLLGGTRTAAQSASGALRGRVTDPSGAVVAKATVSVTSAGGSAKYAETNRDGEYEIKGLAPGAYTVKVLAPSFAPLERHSVAVVANRVETLNLSLQIAQQRQQVTVSAEATHLSVSPENNASSLVLKGKALEALSDDPDEMQAELEALAGPAAGPNGGQIYIDGFTGGQLPPKQDILEIHVNQNPFSAEYDKVGYGRIEIITKPGASQYHGGLFADGNDSAFNTLSPFVSEEPSYHSEFFNGNLGGPLGHKASFFFDIFRRDINDSSIVNAFQLSPSFAPVPFSQAILNPQTRMNITPRVDFQLSPKNVLAVRYDRWSNTGVNNGIGQFSLPSQGFNTNNVEQSLEANDTQVVSDRTVNQLRFRYQHENDGQTPQSLLPAVDVLGAFTSGGNAQGKTADTENNYELQNLTTIALGKHTVMFGGRLRDWNDQNTSNSNFNGAFTFPTINAYALMEQGLKQGLTFQQIQAEGGGPSQFSITGGTPQANVSLVDLGVYGEDDWRMRPNISLSLGLRFESQNDIHDHADFAPRLGFAWGLGHSNTPKTVLRTGFGIFYDRFEMEEVLQAERLNGVNQQQYLVANPTFFGTIPPISTLATYATTPAVYQIDSGLRAPYTIQTAVGIERQVTRKITASVTYLNSHGVHQLLLRNINTPLPGLYNPADPSFGRPFANVDACALVPAVATCDTGFDGNIYQYESDGLYNQNEVIANFRVIEGPRLMLSGFYTLNYADSDAAGINSNSGALNSFVSNPYDILADYGRAAFDIRNRAVLFGAITLPFGFRLMPFIIANSGTPYNITLGQDLLGTSIFNQRPAFAASGASGPNIVTTKLGTFNIAPAPGQALVPINYETGPGAFTFNMHLSKTIGFGKREENGGGGGGWHGHHGGGLGGRGLSGGGGPNIWRNPENYRYNLTFGVAVHNLFNDVNLGQPVGNLGSPLFGQSNSLAGGPFSSQAAVRRVDFQVRFNF